MRLQCEFMITSSLLFVALSQGWNLTLPCKGRAQVSHLKTTDIQTQSIALSWRPPTIHTNCISGYIVQLQSNDSEEINSKTLQPNETTYNFKELKPCSKYLFSVTTLRIGEKYRTKRSKSSDLTEVTKEETPGEVLNLQVEVDYLGFIASWQPPVRAIECVADYVIHYKALNATPFGGLIPNSSVSIKLPNTRRVLHGLAACIEYCVTVQAITFGRKEGLKSSINRVAPPQVFPPPDDGQVIEIGKSTAVLSWQVAYTSKNQCLMDKLITNCFNKAGKAHQFQSTDRHSNGTVFVHCEGLDPFSSYNCTAIAVNSAGESNSSLPIEFDTEQDVPSAPLDVHVEKDTSDSVLISWRQPEIIPGVLTNYTIRISDEGPSYLVPEDCKDIRQPDRDKTVPYSETFALLDNLKPLRQYDISVAAATWAGYGPFSPKRSILTLPNVSEVVRNVTVNVQYYESIVTWLPPCESNGNVANLSLKLTGSRNGFGPVPSRHWYISRDQNWEYLSDLLPETTYTFSISVMVENVYGENPLVTQFTSSARIPHIPTRLTVEHVEVDPKLTSRPSYEALVVIKKAFFNRDNGEIRYLSLLVAEDNMLTAPQAVILANKTWPHATTWAIATSGKHTVMYQATPRWWNPLEGSETEEIRYILGQESCSTLNIHTYCNGPLSPNSIFALRIRVFTSAGYRDSPPIRFKTDVGFPYDVFMCSILGLFVITSLIIITVVAMGKYKWKSGKPEHKYLEELPAKKILAYCNAVLEQKSLMHAEFAHLESISDTLDIISDAAQLPINKPKNRYTNIYPYDFNRVILEGGDDCDYINASYITDDTLRNGIEYVACQAPKENTCYDFWRMIVQCGVRAIVMLCNLREKNQEKCHWYFPEEGETLEFEGISVHCSRKITNDSFIQRTVVINMKNQGEIKIDHYHFVDWPDFGAPSEAIPMIKLCQAVRADVGSATIAVHCSAGVGRTGTYIAVDMLLRHLNYRKKVSVFRTVLRLRGQRAKMVQTEVQYSYIYKVLKHTLDNPIIFFRKGSRLLASRSNSSSLDGNSSLSLPFVRS